MEMFTLPLSLIAFAATLWITSFFARLMSAKKPELIWIFATWLLGIIISTGVVISLNLFIDDKQLLVALTYLTPLIVLTLVYRLLNKMDWIAAITTNITALAVGLIAAVIVIISIGKPLDKTIISMACDIGLVEEMKPVESLAESDEEEYEEVILTEQNLLSPQVIAALEKKKIREKKSYIEPKFQVISIRGAKSAIGYKIRLAKNNGNVLEGILSKIRSGQLIVQQNLYGGVATTPIAMGSVKKLEVYR
ncbi:MAG TPA: hypothetical protein ENJ51_00910 [Leucothrix mucor]|uniref:Uncharacterized protein n=1 Tax=Leucothrix mucor TaxID=45248 RepID=A0A7V2SXQ9_LEUMU|nr:hypothetical protein [Leucothrix mucor]